jgi:hypothetical protein|tara:strand:- start:78 stop:308 length:231 start_codon:yes stop_codon:yes gene_type:complete
MTQILLTATYLFYIVFGFFSFYFAVVTIMPKKDNSIAVRILWWHGIVFILAIIGFAVMSLSLMGAMIIYGAINGVS